MPSFEHTRSITIAAPPGAVHTLVMVVTGATPAEGNATRVSWTMSGTRNILLAIMGRLFFDAMIGKDFEKGLAKLKALVEA